MPYGAVIGQLYFGTGAGAAGFYSNKTTFLADNPGLTLQTFSGIAPPNGRTAPGSFSGFSITPGASVTILVADDGYFNTVYPFTPAPFDSVGGDTALSPHEWTITFSPAVSAVGFNLASVALLPFPLPCKVQFYNGATLLHEEDYPPSTALDPSIFTSFAGYAAQE